MPCPGTKKCFNCHTFFKPTPQSKGRQNYCSQPDCKKASKKASQKKWLSKPENSHYFNGHDNVLRVQQWREINPNYCHHSNKGSSEVVDSETPLQETLMLQDTDKHKKTDILNSTTLQEMLISQVFVLMELIAHLDRETLQEMIDLTRQKEDNLADTFLTKFHQLKGDYHDLSSFTQPQQMSANTHAV